MVVDDGENWEEEQIKVIEVGPLISSRLPSKQREILPIIGN